MQYLGAGRKGFMRLRLALLISAVLTFVPHQSWGKAPVEPSNGADLPARMLAPTVDKEANRPAAQESGYQLTTRRHAVRLNTEPPLLTPMVAFLGGATLSVLWWLSVRQRRVVRRFRCTPKLSRGPPLPQPA